MAFSIEWSLLRSSAFSGESRVYRTDQSCTAGASALHLVLTMETGKLSKSKSRERDAFPAKREEPCSTPKAAICYVQYFEKRDA